jgi:CheY-like chemotaxis protein
MWVVESASDPRQVLPPGLPDLMHEGEDLGRKHAGPRRFVMIEDNAADWRLFERRMREHDPGFKLMVAQDGAAGIDLLEQVIEGTVPRPDLLILDLNLPVLKGWSVLRFVKRSPLLRFLPVVVLSSSRTRHDVERAYRDGVASFIHKGRDLDGFLRAVDAVNAYWCGIADLPGDA